MYSRVSALTKFIVSVTLLILLRVMLVGSERSVVDSLIHASVQLTSSSVKVNAGLSPSGGGGSVVLQLAAIRIKNKNPTNFTNIYSPVKSI